MEFSLKGFQIKKGGKFHIKIKLITKIIAGHVEKLLLYSDIEGKSRYTSIEKKDNENGETIFRETIKEEFLPNTLFTIYPLVTRGTKFTIEEGSYVRFSYSWKR